MQGSQMSIDRYIGELARRLDLPAEQQGETLREIAAHLDELAANYMADGADETTAQRRAVETFGDVRSLGRRLSAASLTRWGRWRWARGIVTGALLSWAIWTVGTFPVLEQYYTINQVETLGSPTPPFADPLHTLMQSMPPTNGAFYAYLTLGWAWLLPLIALAMIVPFLWGRRARRWWAPGLAYGLGIWLAMPWGILYFFLWNRGDWAFQAEATIIILALPLALLASLAGYFWRQWREGQQEAVAEAVA